MQEHENKKNQIKFGDKLVTGKEICEIFNKFFLDRIREISENITPSKSLEETVQQIETEYRMEKFHKMEMLE